MRRRQRRSARYRRTAARGTRPAQAIPRNKPAAGAGDARRGQVDALGNDQLQQDPGKSLPRNKLRAPAAASLSSSRSAWRPPAIDPPPPPRRAKGTAICPISFRAAVHAADGGATLAHMYVQRCRQHPPRDSPATDAHRPPSPPAGHRSRMLPRRARCAGQSGSWSAPAPGVGPGRRCGRCSSGRQVPRPAARGWPATRSAGCGSASKAAPAREPLARWSTAADAGYPRPAGSVAAPARDPGRRRR